MGGAVGLAMNVSMGCGTATIIPDENGSDSELLIDGINGFRFIPGDYQSLADKLEYLLDNKLNRDAFGRKCREDILNKATVPKMVDGLIDAIQT